MPPARLLTARTQDGEQYRTRDIFAQNTFPHSGQVLSKGMVFTLGLTPAACHLTTPQEHSYLRAFRSFLIRALSASSMDTCGSARRFELRGADTNHRALILGCLCHLLVGFLRLTGILRLDLLAGLSILCLGFGLFPCRPY